MIALFSNSGASILAEAITSTQTTATLAPGTGELFPQPTSGQFFPVTFIGAMNNTLREIVYVTSISGDTIEVMTRGAEGTTPQNWNAGDFAQNLITAGILTSFSDSIAGALPIAGGTLTGPLLPTLLDTYVAAGTGQSSATLLHTQVCILVNSVTGGYILPTAAQLPGGLPPGPVTVVNEDQSNAASVFPPIGDRFNTLAVNALCSIAPGANKVFYPGLTAGQWWF